MFLILFQKHPQLLAQRVGKIVRKLAQPFSLPLLSRNLMRRKGLTFRRSRPPTAAAELRALVLSYSSLCRPTFIPALRLYPRFLLWVFGALLGFACVHSASFMPFWPPALAQQAPPAIILAALRQFSAFLQAVRRLGGAVLFRGLRPSSSWGFPFWLLWLTGQSSRPAFGGRLTFVR